MRTRTDNFNSNHAMNTNSVPFQGELLRRAVTRRFPGLETEVLGLCHDADNRELLDCFTECEYAMEKLLRREVVDIPRLRAYRRMCAELTSEIEALLRAQND